MTQSKKANKKSDLFQISIIMQSKKKLKFFEDLKELKFIFFSSAFKKPQQFRKKNTNF